MGRPPARDLTERELEVMHVFWSQGEATAAVALVKIAGACWKPSEARVAVTLVKIARAERIAQTASLFSRLVTPRCKRGRLCPTPPQ